MRNIDVIEAKRKGLELSENQIDFFVSGYNSFTVSEEEMAAFLMAVTLNGFTYDEAYYFSKALAGSGKLLKVSETFGVCVDKHSTGGISDTVTLAVIPILASLGVKVAKVCSETFGVARGTIDRLSMFDGYNSNISIRAFESIIADVDASIIGPDNANIAPSDQRLYLLRRKTATYPSIPLIATSIMAKKIATGASVLVLDVKCGEGSMVSNLNEAVSIGRTVVEIGKRAGIKTVAVLSNLDKPLGRAIGVGLEVREVIRLLKNDRNLFDSDLFEICKEVVVNALILSGRFKSRSQCEDEYEKSITSGAALKKLKQIVAAHGGDTSCIDNEDLLIPKNRLGFITADFSGYVHNINLKSVGEAINLLSGSRKKNGKLKNVGIEFFVNEGVKVKEGQKLACVVSSSADSNFAGALGVIKDSFVIIDKKPEQQKIIQKVVNKIIL